MPLVSYSAIRLGLLGVCFGLGYAAGLRTWLLLAVATFAAWGLSYVLLGRQREAAALYLAQRAERRATARRNPPAVPDPDAAHEDALDEAARSRPPTVTLPTDGPGTASDAAPPSGVPGVPPAHEPGQPGGDRR